MPTEKKAAPTKRRVSPSKRSKADLPLSERPVEELWATMRV